jgi:hypothetical protein
MAGFGVLKQRSGVVVAAWAVVAVLLLARMLLQYGAVPLYGDSDDAMRMVTATDLLNGQGWQDIVEHRDNTPFGAAMHWSRLVDAPIAAIMALARPFVGATAPDVAAIVWPLILLLPLLALSSAIVRRLVPDTDEVTALALPVISLVLLIEFLPGRVDHHSIQILLMLVVTLAMLRWRDRVMGGVIAGLAFATSIAIGLETLPYLAIAMGIITVLWAFDPERYWPATVAFGVTLALGTFGHFLIATAPERYATAACDMISITYVVALGLGGLTLAAVAALAAPLRLPETRLTVAIVAGGAVALVCALAFPHCIAGPYSMVDPRVNATLFAGIAEVQPLWQRLFEDPATGIAFSLAALAAMAIMIGRIRGTHGESRIDWLIAFGFLIASVLLMVVQIRGARFAGAFAIPAGAWLIAEARRFYVDKGGLRGAASLIGCWLLFAGVLQFAVVTLIAPRPALATASQFANVACFKASDYDGLATFPARHVMAPIRIGSHILRYTEHSVVSAGFHRNNAGTLDVLDFFGTDEATARAIAEKRQIDLVVDCAGANEATLSRWKWLRALPNEGTLSLYAVNLED